MLRTGAFCDTGVSSSRGVSSEFFLLVVLFCRAVELIPHPYPPCSARQDNQVDATTSRLVSLGRAIRQDAAAKHALPVPFPTHL